MKNKLKVYILGLLVICFLTACEDNSSEPEVTEPEISSTVLVYMIGQNDLSAILQNNISDMLTGMQSAPEGGNWLVYFDASTEPVLYNLKKNRNGTVTQEIIKTYPDPYSSSPTTLKTVVNEVFGLFPAENYGLIVSSHANGWFPAENTAPGTRSIGSEIVDGTLYSMNIPEMADALLEVPHLKYIMFDACLMGTVEVAYELREIADYMIASPSNVPGEGFPYDQSVPSLLKMKESDFSNAVDHFYTYYTSDHAYFATMSVIKLEAMDRVAETFHEMMSLESTQAIANAITRVGMQNFEPESPCYDFGQLVDSLGIKSDTCITKIRDAISQSIAYERHGKYSTYYTNGIPYNEIFTFSGLTSYIPPTTSYDEYVDSRNYITNKEDYKKMEWFTASGWNLTNRFD